ncbi:hypothetical protein [uncultured Parabacteroides sp.]|jgi:hypothetical protein|uniref:hypothetical protein n=1 Tax=uncultured Parabacteroides sp. TaxID=512312 RepID=UPI002601189C|nr:hypothetical protein [uncultured Parabacteroides sp.]
MENKIKCTCSICEKRNYNSEDYYVDMSFLTKDRPVGISGLLRVRNDAEFLSDCIDSCIDALDELIICYQDCEDNAPEIIWKKQQQYPQKIKVYYYAPPVLCWGLTEEESKFAFSLPDTSIHKLCNYYNYTLSKATYRYAMKIDTDQIYFTNKLKRYCDAYRKESKLSMSIGDYLGKYYNIIYRCIMTKYTFLFPLDFFSQIPMVRRWIMKTYENYLIKEITNNKYALSLSGINMEYKDGKWRVLNRLPFNGTNDHLIFCITKDTYYITFDGYSAPIEKMCYYNRLLSGGWFWYHLQAMRKRSVELSKEWLDIASVSDVSGIHTAWSGVYKSLWLFGEAYEKDIPAPSELLKDTTCNLKRRK